MTTSPLQVLPAICDLLPIDGASLRWETEAAAPAIRHPAAAGIVAPSGKTCHENTKSRRRAALTLLSTTDAY
jgi:hypothetical protein